jgi:LAO/AO transport system kinase
MSKDTSQHSRKVSRAAAAARIQEARAQPMDPKCWAERIAEGDRDALGQAITAVESLHREDRKRVEELFLALHRTRPPNASAALRIGVTGVPGVGKSTFIERFGMHLIDQGHRVAVLAIDPSSARSRGSILGDKTRMEELSRKSEAFIRPSPAATTLGGVARATYEGVALCEAAGYDRILVETVGVGQSETAVRGMTDVFLLLLLAQAGDDLQGIKRGIMEMSDLVVIHKADLDPVSAERAARSYASAIHLFPPPPGNHEVKVLTSSSFDGSGMVEIADQLQHLSREWLASGWLESQRKDQRLARFSGHVREGLLQALMSAREHGNLLSELNAQVERGELTPYGAAQMLLHQDGE